MDVNRIEDYLMDVNRLLIQINGLSSHSYLIGGLEHFLFFHILGTIIPSDFHIFQRGRLNHQPDIVTMGDSDPPKRYG